MADGGQGPAAAMRYRAFISYSHRDAAVAAWLHRRLESYRVPQKLVGSDSALGPVPARLTPVFRDREELPAATDLSAEVVRALAASDCLIVLCSPAAAASPWVAREIETFGSLHPDRPLLLALVDGEPAEAFPPAIRARTAEPLAADLRKSGDGRRLGLLKLVAGMTGLPLDRLTQRDAQRRQRRVMAVTLAALAGLLAMSVLLALAVLARSESERQRQQAEGLVEYMLTDLRDRLKGVGRLDVMTAVNERAMDYYGAQGDLERLPPDSLERRARIIHAMGEDDAKRGDFSLALTKWTEAHRTTAALLAQRPNDPDRIFTHAQSEYWVGYLAYRRKQLASAEVHFTAYARLADRLVAIDPASTKALKERAFAGGNLCSLFLARRNAVAEALRWCRSSLRAMQAVAASDPSDREAAASIPNREGWLADALKAAGRRDEAIERRRSQWEWASRHSIADPQNAELIDLVARAELSLAEALADRGSPADVSVAVKLIGQIEKKLKQLKSIDAQDRSREILFEHLSATREKISERSQLSNIDRRSTKDLADQN